MILKMILKRILKKNFEMNFEIEAENRNKENYLYSNLSFPNLSNLSFISDASLPDSIINSPSLSNLSNLSLISDTSLPDSIINPLNLSNISSNASINRFDEDYLNLESIKCIEGIENNEFNERESIKCISSTSIISPSNSEELSIPCQSKKVIRQGLSDTPAREGGQGIEGETASPAREGGQGCSLLPDDINNTQFILTRQILTRKGETTSPATEEAKGCSLLPDVVKNNQLPEGETALPATEEAKDCSLLPDDQKVNEIHDNNEGETTTPATEEALGFSLLPDVNNYISSQANEDDNCDETAETGNNNNNNINNNNLNITNLIKDFREASENDKALIEPCDKGDFFTLAAMNSCGLRSKHATIANAAIRNKLDVVVISETHMAGRQRPFISNNYTAFFKNRSKFSSSCKGGVAIMVENKLAQHTVMVESGDSNNEEYCAVKINAFEPPVIIMGIYGPQNNIKKKDMDEIWGKIKEVWKKYIDLGCTMIIAGDMNAAIGNTLGLTNNDESKNKAGEILIAAVEELDLHVLNKMEDHDQRTHVDRSNQGSSRCLDYIITNNLSACQETKIDNGLLATPYSVILDEEGEPDKRKFVDHKTVMSKFKLVPSKVKNIVQRPKFIKDELSRAKYYMETEIIAQIGLEMLQEETPSSKIANMISREVKKACFKSHKRVKPNRKAELTEDEAIFWKLIRIAENEVHNLGRLKINNQIFQIRKKRKLAERGDPLFSMNTKTGDVADTREKIEETILKHNEEILMRKEHSKSYSQIHQMKVDIIKTLQETHIETFKSLTIEDYIAVVDKILEKKKEMFSEYIDSSPKFKVMIFLFLKKMYESEDVPDSFKETELIALFKKGNRQDASNYRFIHIKWWLPRIFEMLIYQKLYVIFDKYTPESQTGGCKMSDTMEHLVMIISALNQKVKVGKGLILTLADIKKCFDRLFLSDCQFWLLKSGADPKAVKVLNILLGFNRLKLQGSSSGKSFIVEDGQGQGGVSVGRSAAATISDVMERNVATHPCPTVHNGVNIANLGYVDDTATIDEDPEGTKFSCRIIQEAFEELSLEAHDSKTIHILCGNQAWIQRMKKDLENNPANIQGFNVRISEEDKYLGLRIVTGDIPDIIDANIRLKASKVHQIATEIRQEVRDPRIEMIGSLKASALLVQSKLIPILTYGTESWLRISDQQYQAMEAILKDALVRILSLPASTNYDSMILEVSNFHVEVWIDSLKLKYFMKKLHIKKTGKLYRVLREDIINKNEDGFIGDVRRLCDKYNLPDITLNYLPPEYISEVCKEWSRKRSMLVTLTLKKVPPMLTLNKIYNDHYQYTVFEARAITALRTGNLIFKNWCPWEFSKKNGGRKCMYPPCTENDSLIHVMECRFYRTKFEQVEGPTRDWANYLTRLNQERISEFNQPLITCRGWSTVTQ